MTQQSIWLPYQLINNPIMKPCETPSETSSEVHKPTPPQSDKTLNQKSNRMNISTEVRNSGRHSKEETSPSLGGTKYQSFTKFPPIKKGAEDNQDEIPKTNKDREQDAAKDSAIVKVQLRKKLGPRKTVASHPNMTMLSRFKCYKAFLEMVNTSNNVSITSERLQVGRKYVVYFGKGNNSTLIRNIMKGRPWWTSTEDPEDPKINFVWTQIRQNNVLQKCKSIKNDDLDDLAYQLKNNQKEHQPNSEDQEVSKNTLRGRTFTRSQSVNRESLNYTVKTLKRNNSKPKENGHSRVVFNSGKDLKDIPDYDKQRGDNRRQLVNPKVLMNNQNLRKVFSQKDMKNLKTIGAILQEGGLKSITRDNIKKYEGCTTFLLHNHLENNWHLSNKKALFLNVKTYYQVKKIDPFQYIPVTFHVQSLQSKQYQEFVEYYNSKADQEGEGKKTQSKNKAKKRNIWLVKPGQNTNRGAGIMVCQSLEEIKEIISSQRVDSQGRQRTHILQEYIMPFLYNKRKFDIRSYVLLTSVNGINKGYWFQEGYIRTACKEFNFKNLSNKFIHLTNDAVQKKCEEYGKFQPGNKISFPQFQRYLDSSEPKLKFWSTCYPEMKKLATDTIRAVHTKINPTKKQFSFEIFGLDFMIDDNFKVWLIEANTNPCLELSCPLLSRMIPSMVENAFRVAVDPIFPPPGQAYLLNLPRTFVPDNILEVNRFQLVFDQVQEGKELKSILTNTAQVDIYDIEEEEEEYQQGDKADNDQYKIEDPGMD